MWVLKGVLVGFIIFILGTLAYVLYVSASERIGSWEPSKRALLHGIKEWRYP